MQLCPLICVRDVESSSRWYQRLLGCESGHGGTEYERLNSKGQLILQLHNWEVEHQHGRLGDPELRPYGNGVLLWFELEDYEAAVLQESPSSGFSARPAPLNLARQAAGQTSR